MGFAKWVDENECEIRTALYALASVGVGCLVAFFLKLWVPVLLTAAVVAFILYTMGRESAKFAIEYVAPAFIPLFIGLWGTELWLLVGGPAKAKLPSLLHLLAKAFLR